MKIRKGFVSNSSSSSFVIAIKGGELDEQKVLELFGVPETSPFFDIAKNVSAYIVKTGKLTDEAFLLSNYGYSSLEEAIENGSPTAELIKDGFTVYRLYASYNEGDDPTELFIGNGGLGNIETENFVFKGEY